MQDISGDTNAMQGQSGQDSSLPDQADPFEAQSSEATVRPVFIPIDIVLVEDSANDRMLCHRAIRDCDTRKTIKDLTDGEEALAWLLHPPNTLVLPRMVLLDLKLPKLSGMEVLARLKKEPRIKRIPVIVLSSSNEPTDVANAYDSGASSYIVKAIDYSRFIHLVKSTCDYWLSINRQPD